MLENIRENSQGWTAKIILFFIILTFAVAGIGSYTTNVDTSVATVNGEKISQASFQKVYDSQRNRMAQQFGEMFETLAADASYMNNFRNSVLDNLIEQKLLDQNADELAFRVSDERIKETIRSMPEFQVDGVFNNERYLALIRQVGYFQAKDFRDYLRVEITRRQLTQGIVTTEFSLPYQVEMETALQKQKRDIQYAIIKAEQFKKSIELTDEEINDYYLANQAQFENPEKVKVDYVTLDVNEIAKTINLTDADIEAYYQENISQYQHEEQRKLSHILIEFNDDKAQAKASIEALLTRVKAGEDFATLAKEHSADTFSAENGGDLDWLALGTMDEAFEQAALKLAEVGSVSEVVESEFGYHLIKMTDFKAAKTDSLADVKTDVATTAKNEQARNKFFELQQELARLSFESPDSLDEAAEAVKAKVMTSDWLLKGMNAAPFNTKNVIDVVFSDLVINDKVNSDIIEINEDTVMVLRVNEHQQATIKTLAEVTDMITSTLTAKKASEKAQQVADELVASFQKDEDINAKLAEIGSTFETKTDVTRQDNSIDNGIVRKAFTLPHPSETAKSIASVSLSNGDLALVEVKAVKTATEKPEENLPKQMSQQIARKVYQDYIASLKADADIVRREIVIDSQ